MLQLILIGAKEVEHEAVTEKTLPNANQDEIFFQHRFTLVSPPRRLRAWAPAGASCIPTPFLQPFLRAKTELAVKLGTGVLSVNEIAKAASHAALAAV